jgi:hypothetical protein
MTPIPGLLRPLFDHVAKEAVRAKYGPAVCSSPSGIAQSKIVFYQRFPGGIE